MRDRCAISCSRYYAQLYIRYTCPLDPVVLQVPRPIPIEPATIATPAGSTTTAWAAGSFRPSGRCTMEKAFNFTIMAVTFGGYLVALWSPLAQGGGPWASCCYADMFLFPVVEACEGTACGRGLTL